MKKTAAILSAAVIAAAASATVIAAEPKKSDVTISASIEPAYIVSIPANTSVAFSDTTTDFGSICLDSARLEPDKTVKVTITSDGELNNSADNNTVIPYSLTASNGSTEEKVVSGYSVMLKNAGDKIDLTINITKNDWNAAAAGNYSDIVNFTIAYVDDV